MCLRNLLLFPLLLALIVLPSAAQTINEIRTDQSGTDNDEYFELQGTPSTSLNGLTYLVIGDGAAGSGVIESVVDLNGQSFPTNGFFVTAEGTFTLGTADLTANLNFENSDNVTHLLVQGFTGNDGDDLDTNDDGTLDATPWTSIVDGVSLLIDPVTGDRYYAAATVGPDGAFAPGHVYRDGMGNWQVGQFDPNGGDDTPGAANPGQPDGGDGDGDGEDEPATLVINEIDYDQPGTDAAEFVEIMNTGTSPVNLGAFELILINGNGAVIYQTFSLPEVELAPGDYFVVCGNAANVDNCDLDVSPDDNLIQNGAPDAVALREEEIIATKVFAPGDLIDTVSYEGSVAGYTEGSGDGLADDVSAEQLGISRFPDGADTDQNNVDFSVRCASPGAENVADTSDCVRGEGNVMLTNATPDSPLLGTDIFDRNQTGQVVEITITGSDATQEKVQATLTDVKVTVPDAWGPPGTIVLLGPGFASASFSVSGQMILIENSTITAASPGTVQIAGLSTPNPTDVTDDGNYVFEVQTAASDGPLTPITDSPTAYVVIPLANLRDVTGDGTAADLTDIVAVRLTATIDSGTFDLDNLLVYGEDQTGGIVLFNNTLNPALDRANQYVVKGSVAQFNGLTELVPASTDDIVDVGAVLDVAPQTLTVAQILANAEALEGSLVTVTGAQFVGGSPASLTGDTNFMITDGTGQITFRIDADSELAGAPAPEGVFSFNAVIGQFDNSNPFFDGYQLLPRDIDDVFFGAPGQTTVQFSAASAVISEGATIRINVTIRNPSGTPTQVDVQSTAFGDLVYVFPSTLTFPAGSDAPQQVTVMSVHNFRPPTGNITLLVSLVNVRGGNDAILGLPSRFRLLIQERDSKFIAPPPREVPIHTARQEDDGDEVIIRGIVTRAMGAFLYLQDESGGLTIRQTSGAFFDNIVDGTIRPGTELRVRGVLSSFRGLKQINTTDLISYTILSQDNPLPPPQTVTLAQIAANGEAYEAELIRVVSLTSSTSATTFQAATTYPIADASLAEGPVTLRIPNATDSAVDGLPVPAVFTFEGVLGQFAGDVENAGYQLLAIQADDIQPQQNTDGDASVDTENAEVPTVFALLGNYPNPFNPSTTVRFDLPAAAEVHIEVFDLLGRRVLATQAQSVAAGRDRILAVDAGALASGVYVYRVVAKAAEAQYTASGRITLVK